RHFFVRFALARVAERAEAWRVTSQYMKRVIQSVALAAIALTAGAQTNFEAISSYQASSTNALSTVIEGTAGYSFQVNGTLTLDAVGVDQALYNSQGEPSLEVGVWNALGVLIASNIITTTSTLIHETL